jgi:hypothetical protein
MFGMYAFTPKFAFTYEIPVYRNMDYSSVLPNPPGGIGGPVPPGGVNPPYDDISSSGSTSGYGDLNLRFFYNFDWGGDYAEEGKSWSLFPVIETMLPTASDDILGGDTTINDDHLAGYYLCDRPSRRATLWIGLSRIHELL